MTRQPGHSDKKAGSQHAGAAVDASRHDRNLHRLIAGIEIEIAEARASLEAAYRELGAGVFERHRAMLHDSFSNFANLGDRISQLNADIAAKEAEINSLMIEAGSPLFDDGTRVLPGSALVVAALSTTCAACNETLSKPGAKFCIRCGAKQ